MAPLLPFLVMLFGVSLTARRLIHPAAFVLAIMALAAIGLTEPVAGSDLKNITTEIVPDGDGFVLNGAKQFVVHGNSADMVLTVARTTGSMIWCRSSLPRSGPAWMRRGPGTASSWFAVYRRR